MRATRVNDKVELTGAVSAVAEFECDRCLAILSIPVEAEFDLVYVPPIGTGEEQIG